MNISVGSGSRTLFLRPKKAGKKLRVEAKRR